MGMLRLSLASTPHHYSPWSFLSPPGQYVCIPSGRRHSNVFVRALPLTGPFQQTLLVIPMVVFNTGLKLVIYTTLPQGPFGLSSSKCVKASLGISTN